MKVLIATDAWSPQINGVTSTYARIAREADLIGSRLAFLKPADFQTVPMPRYREIRLALPGLKRTRSAVSDAQPDHIHIATEGPVGWMTRTVCLERGLPFTTSYHTRFPEYISTHAGIPAAWTYAVVRRFHAASAGVFAATPTLLKELAARGFRHLHLWTRGVDTHLFHPRSERLFGPGGPVFLYVGRVSAEKNIEAFLEAPLPGQKVVIRDGPALPAFRAHYPSVLFTGLKHGEDLARHFASADVFVFPSRTDTFGLVILEALASGLPVAAFPVTGPVDIVEHGVSGYLDENIGHAAMMALTLSRDAARARAQSFTWQRATELFLDNITQARASASSPFAINAQIRPRPEQQHGTS